MRLGVFAFICVLFTLAAAQAGAAPQSAGGAACLRVKLSWGVRCIAAGQFCKVKADAEYHRYGYHCHTGRLSRSSAGGNQPGSGCQPGYSPCLPRVADLNCSDIPDSKKPVRVTGSDPYRLDADGDGYGCDS